MATRTNTTRDLLPLAVLALLSEHPRHPYELQRVMRERHMEFAAGRTRAVYAAVESLLRDGFIEAAETSREGRRPERTVYRLTDEGREELVDWLELLLETPSDEQPVFAGAMALLYYVPSDRAIEGLESRLVTLEAQAAALDVTMDRLRAQLGLPSVVLLDHEYRLALLRAETEWLRSLVDRLRTEGLPDVGDLERQFERSAYAARSRGQLRAPEKPRAVASNGTGPADLDLPLPPSGSR